MYYKFNEFFSILTYSIENRYMTSAYNIQFKRAGTTLIGLTDDGNLKSGHRI